MMICSNIENWRELALSLEGKNPPFLAASRLPPHRKPLIYNKLRPSPPALSKRRTALHFLADRHVSRLGFALVRHTAPQH
jgi:hypothetical protein